MGDDLVAAKTGRWPPQYRIRGECGRRVRGASIFDIDEIDSGPENLRVTAANGTAMAENPFAGVDGRDQENVAPGRAHALESHSRAMTDGPRTNFRSQDQDGATGSPRLSKAESDYARAPVPSLYIPSPQTHFIAEDAVPHLPNPPQPLATRTKTVSLIPSHGALSLNHRPRPCVAHPPKPSPDAQGQPQAHLITMMVLHSDDYGRRNSRPDEHCDRCWR